MRKTPKILNAIIILILLNSCGVEKVYTSASYGALKTYTEKPIYKGKKIKATYISSSLSTTKHEQDNKISDKAIAGIFSIHQAVTNKKINYYYGLGGSFGSYQFKSDLNNLDNTGNYFSKNDKLNYYNLNFKTGVNLTKTGTTYEYSIIGVEFIYVNEFGEYIDSLKNLPSIPGVVVVDEKSIFGFNLNSEITFRLNENSNFGFGIFFGEVIIDKEKIENESAFFNGVILKYNYKNITLSLTSENSVEGINSSNIGITYKLFNKTKFASTKLEKSK